MNFCNVSFYPPSLRANLAVAPVARASGSELGTEQRSRKIPYQEVETVEAAGVRGSRDRVAEAAPGDGSLAGQRRRAGRWIIQQHQITGRRGFKRGRDGGGLRTPGVGCAPSSGAHQLPGFGKRFPEIGDVGPHGLFGGVRIAGPQGFVDPPVLGQGLLGASWNQHGTKLEAH